MKQPAIVGSVTESAVRGGALTIQFEMHEGIGAGGTRIFNQSVNVARQTEEAWILNS